MGHGNSKPSSDSSDDAEASNPAKPSHAQKLKQRLHLHRPHFRPRSRHGDGPSPNLSKLLKEEDFAGIALLRICAAEMKFKDKWLACVTLGEQTFRTHVSDHTEKPTWNSEKKLLLEKNGAHMARISLFETNRLSKNNLVGYCEINLLEFLTQDTDSATETFDLFDPTSKAIVVGTVTLSCSIEDPMETERNFARRILSIVDYNEDGKLSFNEFSDLIDAFGNQLAANKKKELFKDADKNGDGVVSIDELASLLAVQQEKEPLINCCPVCGEILEVSDRLNSMIHLTLCFDEGTGNQVMTGGFLTDEQAAKGWMFKLTEWANFSSYDIGLRTGSSASHILVFDRRKKIIVTELIDSKIVLSMRAIYQSKVGLGIMDQGAKEILQSISEKQGKKMESAESAKDDYHRFHSPVSGTIEKFVNIPGCLYTVNPIAVNRKYCNVFTENKRTVCIISTEDFGKCGKVISIGKWKLLSTAWRWHLLQLAQQWWAALPFLSCPVTMSKKEAQLGYFSFGGSIVICVSEKDKIKIDEDLLEHNERSLEILVTVGMPLGESIKMHSDVGLLNLTLLTALLPSHCLRSNQTPHAQTLLV